ncbi:MAG: anti-CBASS Acb1 family protein [Gemmatimonadota bacterium]
MVEEPVPEAKPRFNEEQMRFLSVLLDRSLFSRQAGFQFDGRRDLYDIFGYDRIVTSQQYRDEYARGGIAKQIIEAFPKATWREGVELFEDEDPKVSTPFEKAWNDLWKQHGIGNKLLSADILAGQSTYSVVLLGAPGFLDTELPRGTKLLYLQPFFGGGGPGNQARSPSGRMQSSDEDVTIEEFDVDPESERFGEPLWYRIRRTDLSSPMLARRVHWSRVIHICEGAHDNNVYGIPTLEAIWNLLFDLEKITGGGGESAFQRAKHTLNANIQKDVAFSPDDLTAMKAIFEEYQHGITNFLPTRGMDVKLIESKPFDFGSNADAILKQIAGTTGIPMRILTGSEMGSLASEQDAENFDSRVQDRRTLHAGPNILRKLANRLIAYGILPEPKKGPDQYETGWPTEEEDDNQKADYGVKLATINKTQGKIIITDDEIRAMAFKLEPLTEEQKQAIADEAAEKMQQAQDAMQQTKQVDDQSNPLPAKAKVPALKAAEDRDLLRVLEAAIRSGDQDTVAKVIGLSSYKYGSTQVQLPPSVADKLIAYGLGIPDADVDEAAGGRETDAHVTVKYGLVAPDAAVLGDVQVTLNGSLTALKKVGSLSFTLGKTGYFAGANYDVVYVDVKGEDLAAVNRAIAAKLPCVPSDHPTYQPHATVAYVKPGTGEKYAGWAGLDGVTVYVEMITLTDADGNRAEVALG